MRPAIIYNQPTLKHIIIIFFLTFMAYLNSFNGGFVFDDTYYVVENPFIRDFNYFGDTSLVKDVVINRNTDAPLKYSFKARQVVHFTFALNYKIHGLNVAGYHAVNFYIHVFNALLVYWIVLLLFETPLFVNSHDGNTRYGLSKDSIAFSVALLYAVHPVQTEAVSFISQRFTSLAAFFYFLSVVSYMKWRLSGNSSKRYAYCFVAIAAAMLAVKTKENTFTLPLSLTLIEIIFFSPFVQRKYNKTILHLLPFYFIVSVIPINTMGSKLFLFDFGGAINIGNPYEISALHYLYTQFYAVVVYLRLLIFPVNQNADYYQPVFTTILNYKVLGSLLLLILLLLFAIYLCFVKTRKTEDRFYYRVAAFGILWFFITMLVESSFIVLNDMIVEHRIYLPSFGFFLTVVFIFVIMKSRYPYMLTDNKYAILLIVTALLLTALTYNRNKVWRDSKAFYEDIIKKSPLNYRAQGGLATYHMNNGMYDKAYEAFQNVIRYDFKNFGAHNNLSLLYLQTRQFDKALIECRLLLRYYGTNSDVFNRYGNYFFLQKRFDEAVKQYRKALSLDPNNARARENLYATLNILAKQGSH
ncbi:MAG: tetratricopeptide repeat protein [Nitrospirae bacterium]|nr:tetratricopeptide repeat protein [Nitrospirota bacterium]